MTYGRQLRRENAHYQGIDIIKLRNVNGLCVGNANAKADVADTTISKAYGYRFYILLDLVLLESHMPFHQNGLRVHLEYELTFNDYNRVIIATVTTSRYRTDNISPGYEIVTQPHARLTSTISG